MKLVLDTNCFLRLFLNDIQNQANQIVEFLEKGKRGKIELLVPQIVVFEIQFALEKYYGFGKERIIEHLDTIIGSPYIKVQDKEIFRYAMDLWKAKNVSFADCFIYCFAKEKEAKIFSFDQKLLSRI